MTPARMSLLKGLVITFGEQLFDRHFDSVRRFFKYKVSPADAEDLIQRTFLGCVRGLPNYRGEGTFRAYLFAVARNELYMYMRRAGSRRGVDTNLSNHSVVDLRTGPDTAINRANERALAASAMQRLPVETQNLLELAYWEELSSEELAQIFDVSPITIRTRKHRARQVLRELIEELRGDSGAEVDLQSALAPKP